MKLKKQENCFKSNTYCYSHYLAGYFYMLTWDKTQNALAVTGVGHQALLDVPMTAFFASRQCPGAAIRAATEWTLQHAKTHLAVISGFHSPLEQSVLQLLLQARSPAVAVLARPVSGARLPPHWKAAIAAGHLAVISAADKSARLTVERAVERNDLVARLAKTIVVAHASAGGVLSARCGLWIRDGLSVTKLSEW